MGKTLTGIIKRLSSGKYQVSVGNRQYESLNPNLIAETLSQKIAHSDQPVSICFEVEQGKMVCDRSGKPRLWLPEDPPPPLEPKTEMKFYATGETVREEISSRDYYPRNKLRNQSHKGGEKKLAERVKVTSVVPFDNGNKLRIQYDPPLDERDAGRKENRQFQATDPALAFQVGNTLAKGSRGQPPGLAITSFGEIQGVAGQKTEVHRNPYNFVELAGEKPWFYDPEHPNHSYWIANNISGIINFTAKAETPIFVPEGFPFLPEQCADKNKTEAQKKTLSRVCRRFCRMRNREDKILYAIHGSSLKGVVRSAVEALSNSRMGVVNKNFYSYPIVYRRRCFNTRNEIHFGIATRTNGKWKITKALEGYVRNDSPLLGRWNISWEGFRPIAVDDPMGPYGPGKAVKYTSGLLNWFDMPGKYFWRMISATGDTINLPDNIVERYHDLLKSPHFPRHFEEFMRQGNERPGGKVYDNSKSPSFDQIISNMGLQDEDLIYFTSVLDSKGEEVVTTFGKNVNYLWPSETAVADLGKEYFPKEEISLQDRLSMAERLFGFSGKHRSGTSHPFRGRIRFETLWGPEVDKDEASRPTEINDNHSAFLLELAPLTSPKTRAKARPLYLKPGENGKSSSYSDTNPKMRGRKFYWHQLYSGEKSKIWPMHRRHPNHKLVESQMPPPILALKPGTEFHGRIHFDNLVPEELGALLFALKGDSERHAVKIGKGKPRGLGSVRITITKMERHNPTVRYESLLSKINEQALEGQALQAGMKDWIDQFKAWCVKQATKQSDLKEEEVEEAFNSLNYIKDFKKLHTFPQEDSVRYYPLNFRDYSWLPAENDTSGDPPGGIRPDTMRLAREDTLT
ncbi:MAG: TIGR03986 family CRISPR-associated RAMP protein [Syntrophobacteraceae bacterium]